jgi:hypothetical protein
MSAIKRYAPEIGPSFINLPAGQPGSGYANRGTFLAYAKYDFSVDGGLVSTITPKLNTVIPINAIITECIISIGATTVGSTGNISFGLSAGGAGAAALLGNTARGSLTAGSLWQGIPVQQATGAQTAYIKMSAAGSITITIATNALTAGRAEVFCKYVLPTE